MNNKKLITYEEALNITKNNECFFLREVFFENTKIHIFSYRGALYEDFKKNNAFELRGLSFVYENNKWNRYIALNKYFNVNQNEDWMEEDLKNKKILSIEEKLDGSFISFIKINNKVYPKTKLSLDTVQAKTVQKILEEDKIKYNFINECINMDIMPIFELVSPFNQIVLEYKYTDIILTQLRNMITGEIIPIENILIPENIKTKKIYTNINNLKELLELKHTKTKIEGWVVKFEDGQLAKVKTDWYMNLHGLMTENFLVENIIIQKIINEEIDDILAELTKNSEKRKFIEDIIKKINFYRNYYKKEVDKLTDIFINKFKLDRKKFVEKYRKNMFFSVTMRCYNKEEEYLFEQINNLIFNKSYKLNNSKLFLKEIDELMKNKNDINLINKNKNNYIDFY